MLKKQRKLKQTCFSLFSGCGGLDLGMEMAGFKVVAALDADEICAQSYSVNFPKSVFELASIGKLTRKRTLELAGGTDIDVLVGGPPCPPFSKSRFYRKEKPRGLDDPNGMETVTGYLNVLKWLKPKAFILENVRGLSYSVHKDAMDMILKAAKACGYNVTWKVVNAADYGVPQIRERCIVIGVRSGTFEFPSPTHAKPENVREGLKPWRTAGDVLSDLDTKKNADDDGHFAGGQHNNLLKLIPPGDNYLYFTKERGHSKPLFRWRSRYWSFLLKLSPKLPSWTIQARRSNNMGPFHWRNRILRIEEIKRLQTFPDDWYLAGTVEQQWRQIGNAVPPAMAQAIGAALLDHLRRN